MKAQVLNILRWIRLRVIYIASRNKFLGRLFFFLNRSSIGSLNRLCGADLRR